MDNNFEAEIAQLRESLKTCHKRLDRVETVAEGLYKLSSQISVLTSEIGNMKTTIETVQKDYKFYHETRPADLNQSVKKTIVSAVLSALVAALVALILK